MNDNTFVALVLFIALSPIWYVVGIFAYYAIREAIYRRDPDYEVKKLIREAEEAEDERLNRWYDHYYGKNARY